MSVIWTLPIPMNSVQPTTSAVPSASVCPRVTQAYQYTVIMSHKGCDCDPNSPDPDSFCPFNQYCKNCKEWDLLTFSLFQSFIIILTPLDVKREREGRRSNPPQCLAKGCDCDESLPNADDFCPQNQVCNKEGNRSGETLLSTSRPSFH